MSTATVAPSVANAEPVLPACDSNPDSRLCQQLAAEQALSDLERAVQHLSQRLLAPTAPAPRRRTIPRRSRRSAWLPSDY